MNKIELPRISERIRGFTLPVEGCMHVFDYDEVFLVNLRDRSVEILPMSPIAFEEKNIDFLGVSDKQPLLTVGNSFVSYSFDPSIDFQSVVLRSAGQQYPFSFRTLSGDWFVATLSTDESYLIVAEPYCMEIYSLANNIK